MLHSRVDCIRSLANIRASGRVSLTVCVLTTSRLMSYVSYIELCTYPDTWIRTYVLTETQTTKREQWLSDIGKSSEMCKQFRAVLLEKVPLDSARDRSEDNLTVTGHVCAVPRNC